MGMYGRFTVQKGNRLFVVEPISKFAMKNANWGKTDTTNLPIGGAVHPDDSIITKENGFKNIHTLAVGQSPNSFIDSL